MLLFANHLLGQIARVIDHYYNPFHLVCPTLAGSQLTRYYLMLLGIGADLHRVALDPKHPHRLVSEAEILELMPDLQSPG